MQPFIDDLSRPLSDAEFARLALFLSVVPGGRAMNLEMLDGFFAALIVGPDMVMPSEYWPVVLGGDSGNFETLEQAQDIMTLVQRHWNTIATTLNAGDVYLPFVFEDDQGVGNGVNWAKGFMRGVQMRPESWHALLHDDNEAGAVFPMMLLAHEDDPDPALRPPPLTEEKRAEVLNMMAAGLIRAHRYFEAERYVHAERARQAKTYRRDAPKVGRNEPCPCGSGKKFKQCCGDSSVVRH